MVNPWGSLSGTPRSGSFSAVPLWVAAEDRRDRTLRHRRGTYPLARNRSMDAVTIATRRGTCCGSTGSGVSDHDAIEPMRPAAAMYPRANCRFRLARTCRRFSPVGWLLGPAVGALLPVLLATINGAVHDVWDRQDGLCTTGGGHVRQIGFSVLEQVIGVAGQPSSQSGPNITFCTTSRCSFPNSSVRRTTPFGPMNE